METSRTASKFSFWQCNIARRNNLVQVTLSKSAIHNTMLSRFAGKAARSTIPMMAALSTRGAAVLVRSYAQTPVRMFSQAGLSQSQSSSSNGDFDSSALKTGPATKGDWVHFSYVNYLDDGTEIDKVPESDPVLAQVGDESLLDGMGQAFVGKLPGETFKLRLTPEQREDTYSEENIQSFNVPEEFIEVFEMQVGEYSYLPSAFFEEEAAEQELTQSDLDESMSIPVKVLEIAPVDDPNQKGEVNVTLDFNSQFHADTFNFDVKVVRNFGDNPPQEEYSDDEE
jgi:FKBP-type peptidyl-prolyl cis-trans isomerase 2